MLGSTRTESVGPAVGSRIKRQISAITIAAGVHGKIPIPIDRLAERLDFEILEEDGWKAQGVKGLCLGPEKLIIIRTALAPAIRREVVAHELAHLVLPWHLAQMDPDSGYVMSRSAAEELLPRFEAEADFFASQLLLGQTFDTIADTYRPRIDLVAQMANEFEVTIEFALKRYVAVSPNTCGGISLPADAAPESWWKPEFFVGASESMLRSYDEILPSDESVKIVAEAIARARARRPHVRSARRRSVERVILRRADGENMTAAAHVLAHDKKAFVLLSLEGLQPRRVHLPRSLIRALRRG